MTKPVPKLERAPQQEGTDLTCTARAIVLVAVAMTVSAQPARADADDLGKRIFQNGAGEMPACTVCHMLSDAGGIGQIGPNLDELMPDEARVRIAVHDGVGVMPAFGEALSSDEIDAVAGYVASVAGR